MLLLPLTNLYSGSKPKVINLEKYFFNYSVQIFTIVVLSVTVDLISQDFFIKKLIQFKAILSQNSFITFFLNHVIISFLFIF